MTDDHQSQLLEKIRGLLAKAESTEYPAEADAFTAKAQQLMAAHCIEMAMLAHRSPSAGASPTSVPIQIEQPYAQPKMFLLTEVARANHCEVVWSRHDRIAVVFGFDHDLAAVELLFTSLLIQATRAMVEHGTRTDWSGRNRTRSFRRSFLVGFADRIGWRLRDAVSASTESATADHGSALAPVLANRKERVEAAVRAAFPRLGTVSTTTSNLDGWFAGEDAASRADLDDRPRIAS